VPDIANHDELLMEPVDVVVVSYESRAELRACVEPLTQHPDVTVTVVDNASTDGSLDSIRELTLQAIPLERNGGFAYGCNRGWRAGNAPYVLFLNPDARITPRSLETLLDASKDPTVGAAVPRVVNTEGELDYSLRRFPRLRSTYAQALFLHRLLPSAAWTDELIRDPSTYATAHDVEWASGVCILIRRDILESIGGWDEGFFMYGEDIDLCKRIRNAGFRIRFVPKATVEHRGGASAPRPGLLPTLAASRLRYARKHLRPPARVLERTGIMLGSVTHAIVGRRSTRKAHARALGVALGLKRTATPP
jgi:N-acetylglucosaminyl-diphospho-decaprenol L-rhamnosyltransferase